MTVKELIDVLETVPAEFKNMRVVFRHGERTFALYGSAQECIDESGALVDWPTVMRHWADTETFELVMVLQAG